MDSRSNNFSELSPRTAFMLDKLKELSDKNLYYGWFHEDRPKKNHIEKFDIDFLFSNQQMLCHYSCELIFFTCLENRHDEMFVVLGRHLVHIILNKHYCHPDESSTSKRLKFDSNENSTVKLKPNAEKVSSKECDRINFNYDTNTGGTSLGLWVERVEQSEGREVKLVKGNEELVHYKFGRWYRSMWEKYVKNAGSESEELCEKHLLFHKSSVSDMDILNKYN